MATVQKQTAHTGGNGLFIVGTVFYLAFIGLFLWQTAAFVSWLFPEDQIIYRVITVCVFDVMALFWACIDTFYRFATRTSHNLVKWAWVISFVAALVASVFYMVLQSMTRLDFVPDITWVDAGFAITITVTVLQILFLTFFIRIEWMVRHPRINDYEYDVEGEVKVIPAPEPKVLTPRQSIDTSARQRAIAAPRKQLPRARRFTPSQPLPAPKKAQEVGVPSGPLAETDRQTEKMPVTVRKGKGPYVVNRRPAAIHTND